MINLRFFSYQGRILHRLGICHQVSFIRWFVACFLTHLNPVPPGLRVKDLKFSEVLVRVYEPTSVCDGLRRGLVYIHGGGWVLGGIGIKTMHIILSKQPEQVYSVFHICKFRLSIKNASMSRIFSMYFSSIWIILYSFLYNWMILIWNNYMSKNIICFLI